MNTEFALTATALDAVHKLLDSPCHYVVRIVGPAGYVTYLDHGGEVDTTDDARHYTDPRQADRDGELYALPRRLFYDVIDLDDAEAGSVRL